MKLVDLKTQALRYLALGESDQALLCYRAILRQIPSDLDARMKVADVLVQAGLPAEACRVYAAVAWCDVQAGRPLHALVCCQALADLGQSVSSIYDSLAALYGAGSPRLSQSQQGETARLRAAPPDPETEIVEVDLSPLPGGVTTEVAAELAADTATFTAFPPAFAPVPLLSELPPLTFARISQAAQVRRLGPRTAIAKEGTAGYSLFLLASGGVELWQTPPVVEGIGTGLRRVISRLSEGALVGEMALLSPRPRLATVETTEPTDLLELPVKALRTAAAEVPSVAAALDRFLSERLCRGVIRRSPLFAPFTIGQRLEFLSRFQRRDLPDDGLLVAAGELGGGLFLLLGGELLLTRGAEPFETVEARLFPGDFFGENFLLRPGPSGVTARAIGGAQVLVLLREDFDRMSNEVPAVRRHLDGLPPEVMRELARLPRSLSSSLGNPTAGAGAGSEEDAEFPFLV